MSSGPEAERGLSDALFEKIASGFQVGRRSPLVLALISFAFTLVALALAALRDDGGIGVGAWILIAALCGGLASALALHLDSPPRMRASITFLNTASDVLACAAVALWLSRNDAVEGALAVGFLTAAGGLIAGYAHWRILASGSLDLADGPFGVASRELRLALLALGLWSGFGYGGLIAAAILAHGAVLGHLVRLRLTLRG